MSTAIWAGTECLAPRRPTLAPSQILDYALDFRRLGEVLGNAKAGRYWTKLWPPTWNSCMLDSLCNEGFCMIAANQQTKVVDCVTHARAINLPEAEPTMSTNPKEECLDTTTKEERNR